MISRLGALLAGRRLLVTLFVLTLPLVTPRIRGADEIEYFSYLRSLVFDGDLDFGNEYRHFYAQDPEGLKGFKATFIDLREPTGRHINFAPMGSALLWAPFYLLAHLGVLAARAVGATVAADGFSLPYVASVCYASALYGFLGLLLTHGILRRHAAIPEPAASWTVAAIWFATPVVYYMTIAPGFSHATSLFCVTMMLITWLRTRSSQSPGLRHYALLGALGGLAGMVREQDIFFLLVPGLDLVWSVFGERRLRRLLVKGLIMALAAATAFVPQLLAYRAINGMYEPSKLVARKMNFMSPHFFEVLFNPAHGLFFWSPILLLAVAGLVWSIIKRRSRVPILLMAAFLVQVWLNGSVESWTQAGAFGSRRFVGASVVLAWGLAVLMSAIERRWNQRLSVSIAVFFAWWNLSLMVQFGLKLMDRQKLEWPRVAVSQLTEVPPRLLRTAHLFLSDRERLVRESR
jgi:hypothetical protein